MSVSFSRVPANLRVPLFYVEFDNSMANSARTTQRTLLIGQMSGDTTAKNGQPERISAVTQAASLFGQGSVLHLMTKAYFENDVAAELWVLPFADTSTQTAASGSLTITNGSTDTGVISLYIAGLRLQLVVMATESPATLAGRLATAINENRILPVTAQADADKVILTAKNKGALGNEIDVRLNYLGQAGGEVLPAGLTLNITPLTGGAGAPDLMAGLANLKDKGVDFIVNPYTDTASLNTLQTFLSDNGGRWAWDQQLYGHSFSAVKGTYGQLAEWGEKRNDQHASLMGVTASPSPTYQWSAAYVGAIAGSLRNDPGRPLQTLVINSVLPPSDDKQLTLIERNNLLHSGISTFTVADDNRVQVENIITTYQKNHYGDADDSYLQVETVFLLMFVSRFMRSQITSKFARMKLADDGIRLLPGSAMVTPNIIRAELIAQYRRLATNGYVQNAEAFVKGLQVEKNRHNPNRVDVLWTGTLINQLRIFALLNQFRLQTG